MINVTREFDGIDHSGDEANTLQQLRKAGGRDAKVTARNYGRHEDDDCGTITVSFNYNGTEAQLQAALDAQGLY